MEIGPNNVINCSGALPVENSNVKTEGGPTQFNQNPDKKVKYEKLNLFLRLIFPK